MARGISARISGERFINDGVVYVVEQTIKTAKESYTQYLVDIEDIREFDSRNTTHSIILILEGPTNKIAFVKHVKGLGPNDLGHGKWSARDFYRDTGFLFESKNSKKENAAVRSSNLKRKFYSNLGDVKEELFEMVASSSMTDEAKVGVISAVECAEQGQPIVFKDCSEYHEVIRDYIGEIVTPFCLLNNNGFNSELDSLVTQFGITNTSEPEVSFSTKKNSELIDSTITFGSQSIGISSKGGVGAAAAVNSIMSLYKQMKSNNPAKWDMLFSSFEKEIYLLQTLSMQGIVDSIIHLCYHCGLITDPDYDLFEKLYSVSSMEEGRKLLEEKGSEQFKQIVFSRKTKNESNSFFNYYMLSGLAKALVKHLNEETEYRVPTFLMEVLKNCNIVQIHTQTKKVGSDIIFQPFHVVFPPDFDGKLVLEADKSYYSTKPPQGGLGFKLIG